MIGNRDDEKAWRGKPPSSRPWKHTKRFLNLLFLAILATTIFLLQQSTSYDVQVNRLSTEEESSATSESGKQSDRHILAKERSIALDQQFLSRLSSKIGQSEHRGFSNGPASGTANYSTTIVMGRMKSEAARVQWVYDKLLNIQKREIYIVDDPDSDFPHLDANHGREAAVYFKYILANYDSLPDITFFWHNDEVVWHNNMLLAWNSIETINRMDLDNIMRQGYVPSRCEHWPGCPGWIKFNPSKAEYRLDPHKLEEMFTEELFQRLFPGETDFPPYFAGTCCSQFAATRDTIRSRPKETYQALYNWIMEYERDDNSGMLFEYTWPYIFLNRGNLCPSMEDCYCKTYNLCMDDPKDVEQLEKWNNLRTRREELRWQVFFMESAMESKQKDYEDKGLPAEEVMGVEKAFRPEIDRLNAHLDKLIESTWSLREVIIKEWQLPPPPVGW